MTDSVLDIKPKLAFQGYLKRLQNANVADVDTIARIAPQVVRRFRTKAAMPLEYEKLQQRWRASMRKGSPDYQVYAETLYLADLWLCWATYSRNYLRGIRSSPQLSSQLEPVSRITDLGCGCGYTTAALTQMYPDATVYATNISDTIQFEIASKLGEQYGFSLVPAAHEVPGAQDVVFASEYFEHFEAPIDHLNEIVAELRPRVLVIANAFAADAIGHFDEYRIGFDTRVPCRRMARHFNKRVRALGYRKVKTKLWNGRPSFWVRDIG